ncbi:MAG: hypothetical protein P8Y67_01860 [Alphaproteobacteria bacterium]
MKGIRLLVSGATAVALMTASSAAAPIASDAHSILPSTLADNTDAEQSYVILAQNQSGGLTAKDVKGVSGVALPLTILTKRKSTENNLYAISGLPKDAMLSAGKHRNQIWMVKQKDIHSLSLRTPKGYTGSFHVVVTRWEDAVRPAETCVFLVRISDAHAQTSAIPVSPAPKEKVAKPYIRTQKENMLYNRAIRQLKQTDVAGSRSILEYLASKGDPEAAFALGKSYDPAVLDKMYLQGVEPDIEKAREWYSKARKLGNPQAQSHIEAIDNP